MTISTFLSRRTMLQVSGLGAAALTLPIPQAWSSEPIASVAGVAPWYLRRSSYAGFAGASFAAGATPLTLVGVDDLAAAGARPALRDHEEAFTLTFAGPADQSLTSGIHQLSHPEHGSAPMFLTHVGRPAGGVQRYEATIDRTIRLAGMLDAPPPVVAPDAPAPRVAADAPAVAGAAAAAISLGAPAPGVAARRPAKRIRVRSKARRKAGRVRLEIRFAGAGASAVRVELRRKGRTYGRGSAVVRRGEARLTLLRIRTAKRATYDLVLTITDRRGEVATVTRTVKVR